MAPIVRIGNLEDSFAIRDVTRAVVLTGDRRVYFAPLYEPGRVGVYDFTSRTSGTVGRPGGGPNELPGMIVTIAAAADTIFAFAPRHTSKISPDGHVTALGGSSVVPAFGTTALVAGDGGFVLNMNAAAAVGRPLHLIDRNGEIVHSFGTPPEPPKDGFRDAEHALYYTAASLARTLAPAPNGRFWAAHEVRYEIELFDFDGMLRRRIIRDASWFPARSPTWSGNSWQVRPRPMLKHIWQDSHNRLWVAAWVPDSNWRRQDEKDPGRSNPSRNYDTIIEVLDLATNRLVASTRFDQVVVAFISDDMAVTHNEAPDGLLYLQLMQTSIQESPANAWGT